MAREGLLGLREPRLGQGGSLVRSETMTLSEGRTVTWAPASGRVTTVPLTLTTRSPGTRMLRWYTPLAWVMGRGILRTMGKTAG